MSTNWILNFRSSGHEEQCRGIDGHTSQRTLAWVCEIKLRARPLLILKRII